MKQKLKKIFKNKFILFIIAAIFCGTMGVYAVTYFPSNQVTYDNTSSQLNSTDVQGAIDELYNTCKNAASGSNFKAISAVAPSSGYFYIFFSTDDGIYRMEGDGRDTVKISSYVANAISAVAPGSSYLYIFFSTDDGIYRMERNGSDTVKLY